MYANRRNSSIYRKSGIVVQDGDVRFQIGSRNMTVSSIHNEKFAELDKISTIKELLRVKFGFMSLPLFDAERLDCMLDALCIE